VQQSISMIKPDKENCYLAADYWC